jgi:hypothetical protein
MKRAGTGRALTLAVGAIISVVAVAACSKASAPAAETEGQMHAISRAVFADDHLWLLQDDGSLASLKPDDSAARSVKAPGKVVQICKSSGRLVGLIEGQGKWSLQAHSGNAWNEIVSVPTQDDTFVALDCDDGAGPITIVTNRRLVEIRDGRAKSVSLRQPLKEPLVMGTTLGTTDAIWVGFNVGEWGGGLRRISRSDGTVQTVERNRSGELCGGPLNAACDPVNGIITAPWNPACVVAAIGLVHMMSHGRIVEVCGSNVRRLYYKALDPQPPRNKLDEGEPASTVAFFGLTRSGNRWWAIGIDGLYGFDGAHQPEFRPLPKFENRAGYSVSFAVPGIALVLTDVNQRRSMSGSVPIMAAR